MTVMKCYADKKLMFGRRYHLGLKNIIDKKKQ